MVASLKEMTLRMLCKFVDSRRARCCLFMPTTLLIAIKTNEVHRRPGYSSERLVNSKWSLFKSIYFLKLAITLLRQGHNLEK